MWAVFARISQRPPGPLRLLQCAQVGDDRNRIARLKPELRHRRFGVRYAVGQQTRLEELYRVRVVHEHRQPGNLRPRNETRVSRIGGPSDEADVVTALAVGYVRYHITSLLDNGARLSAEWVESRIHDSRELQKGRPVQLDPKGFCVIELREA